MNTSLDSSVIIDPHADVPSSDIEIIDPRVSEPQGEVEIITPNTALSVRDSDESSTQNLSEKIAQIIDRLPGQIVAFYDAYSRPINLVGALYLGLLAVAIASGVLRVLNVLPLVAPSLKLLGIGFIGWFTWRHLLYAENRQELVANYRSAKQKVLGHHRESNVVK